MNQIELVEVEPGKWRIKRAELKHRRSALPRPYVISDIMEPTEQVDGKFYTSKRLFRAVGRSHGLTEVGNEKFAPKKRSTDLPVVKEQRRKSLQKAVEQYKAGRRVKI
jgi:hypothetical protein